MQRSETATCNRTERINAIQSHLKEKFYRESKNFSFWLVQNFFYYFSSAFTDQMIPFRKVTLEPCIMMAKSSQSKFFFETSLKKSTVWIIFVMLLSHCIWPSAAKYSSNKAGFLNENSATNIIGDSERPPNPRCEKIKIPQCEDIGYNFTDMTLSPANMVKQFDAAPAVSFFLPKPLTNYFCPSLVDLALFFS